MFHVPYICKMLIQIHGKYVYNMYLVYRQNTGKSTPYSYYIFRRCVKRTICRLLRLCHGVRRTPFDSPSARWSTIWDGLCRHETGEELSNEKKWPKQLFRGVVGDEILHSYMGIVSQTIVRIPSILENKCFSLASETNSTNT